MQDSDLEYLIWQFDKRIILSEKKPPLAVWFSFAHTLCIKNQTIKLDISSSGKMCSYFTVFVPTFFSSMQPTFMSLKEIIVNQI